MSFFLFLLLFVHSSDVLTLGWCIASGCFFQLPNARALCKEARVLCNQDSRWVGRRSLCLFQRAEHSQAVMPERSCCWNVALLSNYCCPSIPLVCLFLFLLLFVHS